MCSRDNNRVGGVVQPCYGLHSQLLRGWRREHLALCNVQFLQPGAILTARCDVDANLIIQRIIHQRFWRDRPGCSSMKIFFHEISISSVFEKSCSPTHWCFNDFFSNNQQNIARHRSIHSTRCEVRSFILLKKIALYFPRIVCSYIGFNSSSIRF